ncbi:dNTP triphosphohydrolase [Candidatus Peregrinibacteria bacterium]|nr:MAG: dNTP triphosphohydrolase [Candidatus Peregrinibacteria bacterium]
MLIKRAEIEKREAQYLAPHAVKSSESRGREYAEQEDEFRTCFQRDRDRIIHSKAFRRLRGKTQVFIAGYGDHYRSRLAHSMEVAQLSRDIARALGLNEDLAETIALAHDLGHTPFGHAGQDALHELMLPYGERFEHNEQSRRIVEFLEEKKVDYRGLNVTFEVKDGLLKHRTTYDQPLITDTLMPSLEAQVVNLADEIAYQNHDIDDVFRSGILTLGDFEPLAIWQRAKQTVDLTLSEPYLIRAMVSSLIQWMVNDLIQEPLIACDSTR